MKKNYKYAKRKKGKHKVKVLISLCPTGPPPKATAAARMSWEAKSGA